MKLPCFGPFGLILILTNFAAYCAASDARSVPRIALVRFASSRIAVTAFCTRERLNACYQMAGNSDVLSVAAVA